MTKYFSIKPFDLFKMFILHILFLASSNIKNLTATKKHFRTLKTKKNIRNLFSHPQVLTNYKLALYMNIL